MTDFWEATFWESTFWAEGFWEESGGGGSPSTPDEDDVAITGATDVTHITDIS